MKRRRSSVLVFVGLLCIQLGAIGGAPGAKSITQQVSAARGGTIKSPSGGLTLSIPPGALEKDTSVTIDELAPGEGPVLGPTYELGPSGLKFCQPATLIIRFKPGDIPKGFETEDVAVTEVSPEGKAQASDTMNSARGDLIATGGWKYLDSDVDVAAGTVTARIMHFSRYSARSYSSYTLGSGKRLFNPRNNDYYLRNTDAKGSGFAKAEGSAALIGVLGTPSRLEGPTFPPSVKASSLCLAAPLSYTMLTHGQCSWGTRTSTASRTNRGPCPCRSTRAIGRRASSTSYTSAWRRRW